MLTERNKFLILALLFNVSYATQLLNDKLSLRCHLPNSNVGQPSGRDAIFMQLLALPPHEEWREIKDYDGRYQVSNLGRIKSIARDWVCGRNNATVTKEETILRPGFNGRGYLQVCLSMDGKIVTRKVHRLVAIAFHPNAENKPQVNHKDGIKYHNEEWNLEWSTASENLSHAYNVLGRSSSSKGKRSENAPNKRAIACFKDGQEIKRYNCILDAMRIDGYNETGVSRVIRGRQDTFAGYFWSYV